MAGTVRIWWHDGAVIDVRHNDVPVVNEPEIAFESVLVSGTPSLSGPAPQQARVAIIETDVAVRYHVRRQGETGLANAVSSKPIAATVASTDAIGVEPGYEISFVEL